MNILIDIYFLLNFFFAGFYLAQEYKWSESKRVILLITFLTLFIGCAWNALVLIYASVTALLKWIDGQLQIRYWFAYYFTDKWKNLPEHKLDTLNRIAKNHFNGKSLKHRNYRKALDATNKLNNYTYNPNKYD